MSLKLIISWAKTNLVKILLVILLILVFALLILGWWLKIRGFKVVDLISRLQMANANNEISHLNTKKAVLKTKKDVKEEVVVEIEKELLLEQEKVEKAKLQIEGLDNEEIANRLTALGF